MSNLDDMEVIKVERLEQIHNYSLFFIPRPTELGAVSIGVASDVLPSVRRARVPLSALRFGGRSQKPVDGMGESDPRYFPKKQQLNVNPCLPSAGISAWKY